MAKLTSFTCFLIALTSCTYGKTYIRKNDVRSDMTENHLLHTLMEDVYNLRKENQDLTGNLESLRERLLELETSDSENKHKSRPVVFSAQLGKAETTFTKCPSTIVFDHTLINIEGGYDTEKGIFTAPISGLYSISVSLTTPIGSYVFIMLNGQSVEFLNYVSTGWNANGATVNLQLKKHDKVWVAGKGTFYGYTYSRFPCDTLASFGTEYRCYLSSFSGFLIKRD